MQQLSTGCARRIMRSVGHTSLSIAHGDAHFNYMGVWRHIMCVRCALNTFSKADACQPLLYYSINTPRTGWFASRASELTQGHC